MEARVGGLKDCLRSTLLLLLLFNFAELITAEHYILGFQPEAYAWGLPASPRPVGYKADDFPRWAHVTKLKVDDTVEIRFNGTAVYEVFDVSFWLACQPRPGGRLVAGPTPTVWWGSVNVTVGPLPRMFIAGSTGACRGGLAVILAPAPGGGSPMYTSFGSSWSDCVGRVLSAPWFVDEGSTGRTPEAWFEIYYPLVYEPHLVSCMHEDFWESARIVRVGNVEGTPSQPWSFNTTNEFDFVKWARIIQPYLQALPAAFNAAAPAFNAPAQTQAFFGFYGDPGALWDGVDHSVVQYSSLGEWDACSSARAGLLPNQALSVPVARADAPSAYALFASNDTALCQLGWKLIVQFPTGSQALPAPWTDCFAEGVERPLSGQLSSAELECVRSALNDIPSALTQPGSPTPSGSVGTGGGSRGGLSAGAIVGIVLAVLVVGGALAGMAGWWLAEKAKERRQYHRRRPSAEEIEALHKVGAVWGWEPERI